MTIINPSEAEFSAMLALAEDLRSDSCPPPEQFLAASWQTLDASTRLAIQGHAADCAACQAERMLAAMFDDNDAQAGAPVSSLAARLAQRMALAPPAPAPRRRWRGAAAAATGALALGLGMLLSGPDSGLPDLPERGVSSGVVRGAGIELYGLTDSGAAAVPALLWSDVVGAVRYEVAVRNVAGDVIWSGSTTATSLELTALPDARGVRRHWEVRAIGPDGGLLAQSALGVYSMPNGAEP